MVDAFARGDILQVLLVATLMGLALLGLGRREYLHAREHRQHPQVKPLGLSHVLQTASKPSAKQAGKRLAITIRVAMQFGAW